jgi:hypothetical protein
MALNGISTLNAGSSNAKNKRQVAKMKLAMAKRKGLTVVEGAGPLTNKGKWTPQIANGSTSGMLVDGTQHVVDATKPWYREWNEFYIYWLPTRWLSDGTLHDHGNSGGLKSHRPWKPHP